MGRHHQEFGNNKHPGEHEILGNEMFTESGRSFARLLKLPSAEQSWAWLPTLAFGCHCADTITSAACDSSKVYNNHTIPSKCRLKLGLEHHVGSPAGQGERWGDLSQKPGPGGPRGHGPPQSSGGPGGGPPQHAAADRWTAQQGGGSERWTSGAGGGQADRQPRWGPQGDHACSATMQFTHVPSLRNQLSIDCAGSRL